MASKGMMPISKVLTEPGTYAMLGSNLAALAGPDTPGGRMGAAGTAQQQARVMEKEQKKAEETAKRKRQQAAIAKAAGTVVGAAAGGVIGGPIGAAMGGSVGGSLAKGMTGGAPTTPSMSYGSMLSPSMGQPQQKTWEQMTEEERMMAQRGMEDV